MVCVPNRSGVLHLLGFCLFLSLAACFQEVTPPEGKGIRAFNIEGIHETFVNQANFQQSEKNTTIVEDAVFDFIYPSSDGEVIWSHFVDDISSGCGTLSNSTDEFMTNEKNKNLLQVELQCETTIFALWVTNFDVEPLQTPLRNSSVFFSLTFSIIVQNMENTYMMDSLLSQYESTLKTFMNERMYIPDHNSRHALMQDYHSFTIQANDTTNITASPTIAPDDDELFTRSTLMTLGLFFIGTFTLIFLICYFSMRRSMNKIVVGIGD